LAVSLLCGLSPESRVPERGGNGAQHQGPGWVRPDNGRPTECDQLRSWAWLADGAQQYESIPSETIPPLFSGTKTSKPSFRLEKSLRQRHPIPIPGNQKPSAYLCGGRISLP
ncbi:MAG: hypothetical protein RBR35_14960, partial [Salinivirgaceae bacterium]|nr:hypothetical protein [Salinivirgaceae bacterium]